MKSFKICRTSLTLMVLLAAPAAVMAQSDCSQIVAHGVFGTAPTDSLEKRTRAFVNWLSQNTFDSYAKAVDAAQQLGFTISDIPAQIGGHARASDWRNYQASLQTLDMSDKRNLSKFSQIVNTADQGMAKAWQTCVSNSKGEAHAAIELSYDPMRFTVRLSYDAAGAPPAKIRDFAITPESASCTPAVNSSTTLESSGLILNCTRRVASDAVQITGNTDKGTLLANLPGLTPPSSVATRIIDTPLGPPPGGCTTDAKVKANVDDKTQVGSQPVYVCP